MNINNLNRASEDNQYNDMSMQSENSDKVNVNNVKSRNWKDIDKNSDKQTPLSDDNESPHLNAISKTKKTKLSSFESKPTPKSNIYRAKTKKNESEMIAQIEEERNRKADAVTLRQAKQYKYWVILPDDRVKDWWDMFINMILLFIFFVTPYRIAFIDSTALEWYIIDYFIDFCFV